jgi:hypothetical protein
LLGEAEPLELGNPPDHQSAKFGIAIWDAWSEISHTGSIIRSATEYPVEPGPALGLDFLFQGEANFLLAARPEFQRDAFLSPRSEAAADVFAADDEVSAVVGATSHQDMDMGIVGVPMIHCHPIQLGTEIAFGIGHQFASEGAEIRHLGRILGRNREAKVMPIILTSLRESLAVGVVRLNVEYPRVGAIAGNPFTFEIRDVLRKRRRAKSLALMANDPSHDDDPPTWRTRSK